MANITYLSAPKKIVSYNILGMVQEINQKRFGGKINILQLGEIKFSYPDFDSFYCWEDSPKRLGWHPPSHPFMCYVEVVFRNELGAKMKAKIMNEEKESWLPNPKKYSSYMKWLDIRMDDKQYYADQANRERYIANNMMGVPQELQDF